MTSRPRVAIPHDLVLRYSLRDATFWTLVGSNVFTSILAIVEAWPVASILWIYWIQSVVIGAVHFVRLRDLKDFTTKGLKVNGRAVEPTEKTKNQAASFFAIHYGIFHAGYLAFLLAEFGFDGDATPWIAAGGGVFLAHHVTSFLVNRAADSARRQNLGLLLFSPYGRIVPMHVVIVLGSLLPAVSLVLFLVLKMLIDASGHVLSHVLQARPDLVGEVEPTDARPGHDDQP